MPANQSSAPAIQVQGLQKSFKTLEVLRGVDIEVARGSIFALLGYEIVEGRVVDGGIQEVQRADMIALVSSRARALLAE